MLLILPPLAICPAIALGCIGLHIFKISKRSLVQSWDETQIPLELRLRGG